MDGLGRQPIKKQVLRGDWNCAGPGTASKLVPEAPDGACSAPFLAQIPNPHTKWVIEEARGRASDKTRRPISERVKRGAGCAAAVAAQRRAAAAPPGPARTAGPGSARTAASS
eukprot:14300036-Alexandrium_andersonii.AAC.1